MRVFTILFYAGFLILVGIALMAFSLGLSLNLLRPQFITDLIAYLQYSFNIRLIIGFSGLTLILISIYFAQVILGRFQREKTIAFTTATGEVTIALSAVEDLIRHFVLIMPEIKELKPDVVASKKGIFVNLRLVLKSEANLPELTSRLQELTKSKIQEVLGIDEDIVIKIHIAKIISRDEKERRKEIDKEESAMPYGGYGRV